MPQCMQSNLQWHLASCFGFAQNKLHCTSSTCIKPKASRITKRSGLAPPKSFLFIARNYEKLSTDPGDLENFLRVAHVQTIL